MGQDQQVIIDRTDEDGMTGQASDVTLRQERGDQVAWYRQEGIELDAGDQAPQQDRQQPGMQQDAQQQGMQQADPRVEQLAMRASTLVDEWEEPAQMRERRTREGSQPGTFGTQPDQGSQPGEPSGDEMTPQDEMTPASGQQPVGRDGLSPRDAQEGAEPSGTAMAQAGEPHMTNGQLQVTLVNAMDDSQEQQPAGMTDNQQLGQETDDRVDLDVSFQDDQGREVRLQAKRAVHAPIEGDMQDGAITSWGDGPDAEYGAWFVADLMVDGQVVDSDRLVYLSAQPLDGGLAQTDPATGQQEPPGQEAGPQGQPISPQETQSGTARDRAAIGGQTYAVHLVALPVTMAENQPGRAEPLRILHDLQAQSQAGVSPTAQGQEPYGEPDDAAEQPGMQPGADQPGADQPGMQPGATGQQPMDGQQGAAAQDQLDILHIVFGDAEVANPVVSQPTG